MAANMITPAFDLVCVGVIAEDTITEIRRPAGHDDRVVADCIVRGGGGPAATAAVAAARSGLTVAVVGCVGDDATGHSLIAELDGEGVDTRGIRVVGGAGTSQSVIVVDRSSDTRTIYNMEGPPISTQLDEAARSRMASARWVHCDQFGWRATRAFLEEASRCVNVSVDAGNAIPGLDLREVALYVPTEAQLRARYADGDSASTRDLLRRSVAEGAAIAVATRGSNGAIGVVGSGPVVSVPAPSGASIRSTLGAGDVFHGALLAALRIFDYGDPEGLERCLTYASTAATLSCRSLDGRSAIPTSEQLLA